MGSGRSKPTAEDMLAAEAAKPADASDLKTKEEAIAEVRRLRQLLAEESASSFTLVVWGATGLRDADFIGTSDSYCVVRVGPAAAAWDELPRGSGRRSEVVTGSTNPKWDLGMRVLLPPGVVATDATTYAEPGSAADGFCARIRVFDKDIFSKDDFLGEAVVPLGKLLELVEGGGGSGVGASKEDQAPALLSVELAGKEGAEDKKAKGTIEVGAGPAAMLDADPRLAAPKYFEKMAKVHPRATLQVEDLPGRMFLGRAPLPAQCRGLFWLTNQKNSSAVVTFGGPSDDGGGCSTGKMDGREYRIRVPGDRCWGFASDSKPFKLAETFDLVYNFVFDDGDNPTKAEIYPEARKIGLKLTAEWIMNFEMYLVTEELKKDHPTAEKYSGSVVWQRETFMFGKEDKSSMARYELIQIIDEDGKRIEPAFTAFKDYQSSDKAGDSPGKIFIHDSGDGQS